MVENNNTTTKEESSITQEAALKVEEKQDAKVDKKNVKDAKPEMEREYVIPVRKRILKVPRYKRAKRAIRTIQDFLARHMKVEGRDTRKVKIDKYLNEEMWFRGIKKPITKVKVRAKKINGIVYAELAEVPKVVQYKMDKEKRFQERVTAAGSNKPKATKVKSSEKTVENKVDEAEKEKASAEADSKENKFEAKTIKHETSGAHTKKTTPRRQSLKK